MPAAAALARNVGFCSNALLLAALSAATRGEANPNGFGLRIARKLRNVVFVQFVPVYRAALLALGAVCPLKNPRNTGSGAVPAAPVKAKVLPRPAAMFA